MVKACSKCKEEKDLSNFSKNKSYCKVCANKAAYLYRQANLEAVRLRNIEWRLNNSEKAKLSKQASDKTYRFKNLEKLTSYNKLWRTTNRLSIKIKKKPYNLIYNRQYAIAHPEKLVSKGIRFFCTFACKPLILKRDSYCCQLCGIHKPLQLHHIHPVKYDLCGDDVLNPNNLIILCKSCHLLAHDGDYHKIDINISKILLHLVEEKEKISRTFLPTFQTKDTNGSKSTIS